MAFTTTDKAYVLDLLFTYFRYKNSHLYISTLSTLFQYVNELLCQYTAKPDDENGSSQPSVQHLTM
jgi:hypothetical protein